MPIKLNGATSGSVELDVPAAVGSDLQLTLPATAGDVVVKAADGSVDLGNVDIDSSGNVGIGTSTPGSLNSSANQLVVGSGSGNQGLTIFAGSSSDSNIYFADGTAGAAPNIGYIQYRHASDRFDFGTNDTTRMIIDSSGRVGIGVTDPGSWNANYNGPMAVIGSTSNSACGLVLLSSTAGSSRLDFSDGAGGFGQAPGSVVYNHSSNSLAFATDNSERMRIGQNGFFKASNLGSYFDTSGNYHEFRSSVNNFQILRVEHTSNVSGNGTFSSVLGSNCNNTSSYHFVANTAGDRMFVYGNGNVVNTNNSYGSLSDVKLKENIVDANSQWDDLKALQVRKYNFKEGQTHTQIGLVAQEAELVSPGIVTESPDRDEDGNDLGTTTKSVNYSVLYMKAVKALQEAMTRIETLETKVAALEAAS